MHDHIRRLLALGHFSREERLSIAAAADQAAFAVEFQPPGRDAGRWIDEHQIHGILLDETEGARAVCLEVRAQGRYAHVPMLSLAHEVDDLSFADLFSWGGDDAVQRRDAHGLVTRLRALPLDPMDTPGEGRGTALIVEADRARRIALGRVLRSVGYGVEFAVAEADAVARVREHAPKIVVSGVGEGGPPGELIRAARGAGSTATWIVTCAPRDFAAVRAEVEPLGNVAVTDGYAPPENVVFLANELERGGASNKRASRRLLYGTSVAFRVAGRDTDERGYSYNVSAGGLYVRTLALPEDDVVWLELRPPRSERRVRLEGRVVWRRNLRPSAGATVPPGFGVAIADGARRELEAWQLGYAAFGAALGYQV